MTGYQPRERTRTYLEMTAPDALRPSGQQAAIRLEERPPGDAEVKRTMAAVARPYGWRSAFLDDAGWERYFASGRRYWLIRDGEDTIGSLELAIRGEMVEIDTFGLVPEAVGTGRGGAALTEATRLAWGIIPGVRRVWLHTNTRDNANALPNYQARGFVPFATKLVKD